MLMVEYIGLVNLVGGIMAVPLMFSFGQWVLRDWHSLSRISAGALVFVFLAALVLRGYESLYYGAARFLLIDDVNLWTDKPWVTWVAIVRTAGIGLMLAAYGAKLRADGLNWRRVAFRVGLFACFGIALMAALHIILVR